MKLTRSQFIGTAALAAAAVIAYSVADIYAVFWRAPGAMVWPNGCNREDCALPGTLRAVPWSNGLHELTQADGAIVKLPKGSYSRLTYPTVKP